MNTYDFVHLSLDAMDGEIRGKTKLQKTIYFLGLLTNMVDELGYRPHFYGPYSAEVAGAAQRLRALGFAAQTVASVGAVDSSGFEVARYDLSLTEEGKCMARAKAKKNPKEWERIKDAARIIKDSDETDYMTLSIAAKTYFMLGKKKGAVRIEDMVSQAKEFRWSITPDQVREAVGFLESVGLVTFVK